MVTVEYCKDGIAVSDFELKRGFQFFSDFAESLSDEPWKYATENIFYKIRLAILQGEIQFPIMFKFGDELFSPIGNWPKGFCETVSNLSLESALLLNESEEDKRVNEIKSNMKVYHKRITKK